MTADRFSTIVLLRVRSLFQRNAVEQELDDELRYHIERQTAENIRQGMSPDAARTSALRALGGVSYRKEQARDTRRVRWVEEALADVRFAARTLRRSPGFTIAVILTLALGIGANTAMFTLLRGTLLRSLPNRDGARLVYLHQAAPGALENNILFSVPEINDFRASAKSLGAIADYSASVPFTVVGDDGKPQDDVHPGVVSGNFFEVMGLQPVVGRLFDARDEGPTAPPVAVLAYEFWRDHYGSDPNIVGHTVRLNDLPARIVGVVQEAPRYPEQTDLYMNNASSPHNLGATMVLGRSHRMSEVFARLAPGATVAQATEEIRRISTNMFHDHPADYRNTSRHEITLQPLTAALNARATLTFWLLMGAAAFVLLIACANVSNLTLMRGVVRERELLVRAALGASGGRLRRLIAVENLLLATVGGGLGALGAFAGVRLLSAFAAQFTPRAAEVRVDGGVLLFCLATSVAAALALTFVPRIGGSGLSASLLPGLRRGSLDRSRQRFQQSLVVAQVALSMVLLTGAGLLVRTLMTLDAVDTGVELDHAVTFELPLQGNILKEIFSKQNAAKYELLRDRIAHLPGVQVASLAAIMPFRPSGEFKMQVEGSVAPTNQEPPHAGLKAVDADYFKAVGIPLLLGRSFEPSGQPQREPETILSASLAKRLFGTDNPLGRRVAQAGDLMGMMMPDSLTWLRVVGVVGDTRDDGLEAAPTPTMYTRFARSFGWHSTLIVRTAVDPKRMQPTIVTAIRELYPQQAFNEVATIEELRDAQVAPQRVNAMFIASFGVLAFLIAMVGIAGVLAFSVSSRTGEIGIRMSLGADGARVRRMVLREGGMLLGAGVVAGFAGALAASQLLRSLLFGVTPHDPVTLAGAALALIAVGLAACWLPAARAARVDPVVALRADA